MVDFLSGILLYAAVTTALFERERTGRGRLVEVAMQEAAYATLTSHLEAYWHSGTVPPRTGNRSHARSPLNVYPTNDGYVAINVAVEEHWHQLLAAMGRTDLRDDPRFKTNADRVAHLDETDAPVGAWTRTLGKMEVFTIAKRYRIPCAPVRDVAEVMHDPHMHERGMLEWIEHDEIGRIVVPTTPLRIHGADRSTLCPARSSASITARSMATGSDWRPPRSRRSNKPVSSESARQPPTASSTQLGSDSGRANAPARGTSRFIRRCRSRMWSTS